VVLAVLLHLARSFHRGALPPTAEALAMELEIPPRLLLGILELLQRLELVTEVAAADGTSSYLPARDPETLTLLDILTGIANEGTDYAPPPRCPEAAVIIDLVEQLAVAGGRSLSGVTLRDLVWQAEKCAAGRV
jgi:DNA-binding IscR family transcriptional regulator